MRNVETKRISLVVPVLNEQESIGLFLERVLPVVEAASEHISEPLTVEVVFVDDGSRDETAAIISAFARRDKRVKLVSFSRNFGKEAALSAGLKYATGDAVIPMDVDLQDPPEVVPEMISKWAAGAKVVEGVRIDRSSDTFLKRLTAGRFYDLFNRLADHPIPANVGDFRLMDREVVDVLLTLGERTRFNKSLFSWVGFSREEVAFVREQRAKGASKWRYWKLWNFALDGIVSSSTAPLRVWTYVGTLLGSLAVAYAGFILVAKLLGNVDVPGYASLMVTVLFLGALNLISLGVLGEYIGRISTEVRGRPLYIVEHTFGIEASDLSKVSRG